MLASAGLTACVNWLKESLPGTPLQSKKLVWLSKPGSLKKLGSNSKRKRLELPKLKESKKRTRQSKRAKQSRLGSKKKPGSLKERVKQKRRGSPKKHESLKPRESKKRKRKRVRRS